MDPRSASADPSALSPESRKAPKRPTLNIDLGPLRAAVDAQAKAQGLRVSDLVRHAVQAHLDSGATAPPPAAPPEPQPTTYRPDLTAADAAKLDQLMAKTGRRTRLGVLRAVINGIDLSQAGDPAAGAPNLATAVQQLLASNHQLAGIGRNLNQIARSLNQYPGKTTPADRMLLEHAAVAVQSHLVKAAQLVAELRPLVRLPSEGQPVVRKRNPAGARKAAPAAKP